MSSAPTDTLRVVNRNLRASLARLSAKTSPTVLLNASDLTGLLKELLCAGDCVRSFAARHAPDAELEKAISEYRSTVEQLAQILPRIHGQLLTEKARLQIARAHLAATAAWAQASQNTL